MGYIRQEEIEPIIAKQYLISNWDRYDVVDTVEDFIALLNILQACGKTSIRCITQFLMLMKSSATLSVLADGKTTVSS